MVGIANKQSWERQKRRAHVAQLMHLIPSFREKKELRLAFKFGTIISALSDKKVEDYTIMQVIISIKSLIREYQAEETKEISALLCCFLLRATMAWCSTGNQVDGNCPLGTWYSWRVNPDISVKIITELSWLDIASAIICWTGNSPKMAYELATNSSFGGALRTICIHRLAWHLVWWIKHSTDGNTGYHQYDCEKYLQNIMEFLDSALLEMPHEAIFALVLPNSMPLYIIFVWLHTLLRDNEFAVKKGIIEMDNSLNQDIDASITGRNTPGNDSSGPIEVQVETFNCISRLKARLCIIMSQSGLCEMIEKGPSVDLDTVLRNEHAIQPALKSYMTTEALFSDQIYQPFGHECLVHFESFQTKESNPISESKLAWIALHILTQKCMYRISLNESEMDQVACLEKQMHNHSLEYDPNDCRSNELMKCCSVSSRIWAQLEELSIIYMMNMCWRLLEDIQNHDNRRLLVNHVLSSSCCRSLHRELTQNENISRVINEHVVALVNKLSKMAESNVQVFGQEVSKASEAIGRQAASAVALAPEYLLKTSIQNAVAEPQQCDILVLVLNEYKCLSEFSLHVSTEEKTCVVISVLERSLHFAEHLTENQLKSLEYCILQLAGIGSGMDLYSGTNIAKNFIDIPRFFVEVLYPLLFFWSEDEGARGLNTALVFRLCWKFLEHISMTGFHEFLGKSHGKNVESTIEDIIKVVISRSLSILSFQRRRIDLSSFGLESSQILISEARKLVLVGCHAAISNFSDEMLETISMALINIGFEEAPVYLSRPLVNICLSTSDLDRVSNEVGSCKMRVCSTPWELANSLAAPLQIWAILWENEKNNNTNLSKAMEELSYFAINYSLDSLREAIVISVANLLPCCTTGEFYGVLAGLEVMIHILLEGKHEKTLLKFQRDHHSLEEVEWRDFSNPVSVSLILEILCRAIHLILLAPGWIAIAGEHIKDIQRSDGPSDMRILAASRLVQHLNVFCHDVTYQQHNSIELQILVTVRAFLEVSRCIIAIAPLHEQCKLDACLLYLAKLLKKNIKLTDLVQMSEINEMIEELPCGNLRTMLSNALNV